MFYRILMVLGITSGVISSAFIDWQQPTIPKLPCLWVIISWALSFISCYAQLLEAKSSKAKD